MIQPNRLTVFSRGWTCCRRISNLYQTVVSANNGNLIQLIENLSMQVYAIEQALGRDPYGKLGSVSDRLNRKLIEHRKGMVPLGVKTEAEFRKPKIDPARVSDIENQWLRLRSRAPDAFPHFLSTFKGAEKHYDEDPTQRCSLSSHGEAALFGEFLKPYSSGAILDIGCGPYGRPVYLDGVPSKRVFGVDPLAPRKAPDFTFRQAFGEFLPWADDSFDTIVSATTLDHFFLLDLGMDEVKRCLKPGGFFVCWIAVFEGAPKYDPVKSTGKPVDDEHLFHIDRAWFDPMMIERGLVPTETLSFEQPFRYDFFVYQNADG